MTRQDLAIPPFVRFYATGMQKAGMVLKAGIKDHK